MSFSITPYNRIPEPPLVLSESKQSESPPSNAPSLSSRNIVPIGSAPASALYKFFLDYRAQLSVDQKFGLFIKAAREKDLSVCESLLGESDFPLERKDRYGMNILQIAAEQSSPAICKLVLDHAPHLIYALSSNGQTPLYWTIVARNTQIATLMLSYKTPLEKRACLIDALEKTIQYKQAELVPLLIDKINEPEFLLPHLDPLMRKALLIRDFDTIMTLLGKLPQGYTPPSKLQEVLKTYDPLTFIQFFESTKLTADHTDPLFQELIQLKPHLDDYESIYSLLLAARNLKKYQPLLQAFDNGLPYEKNPAAQIAFAISGYVLHFENQMTYSRIDHFNILCDKYLHQARTAENRQESLLSFYRSLFISSYPCFDARISDLETYGEDLELNPDFRLKLIGDHETQAGEYFRVFRYLKIQEMAQKEGPAYKNLKQIILSDDSPENEPIKRAFYAKYCTWEEMQGYLSSQSAPSEIENLIEDHGGFAKYFDLSTP